MVQTHMAQMEALSRRLVHALRRDAGITAEGLLPDSEELLQQSEPVVTAEVWLAIDRNGNFFI